MEKKPLHIFASQKPTTLQPSEAVNIDYHIFTFLRKKY